MCDNAAMTSYIHSRGNFKRLPIRWPTALTEPRNPSEMEYEFVRTKEKTE